MFNIIIFIQVNNKLELNKIECRRGKIILIKNVERNERNTVIDRVNKRLFSETKIFKVIRKYLIRILI
jgi:hypothetical protein